MERGDNKLSRWSGRDRRRGREIFVDFFVQICSLGWNFAANDHL